MSAHSRFSSYEEAVAAHEWRVPDRYNIAEDVCDKHPPEQLAMLWEDFRGNERTVTWGELQDASNRLGSVLRRHGVEVGDRVAMLLTPRPETAAAFLGTFKAGAILLSLSVLYGDDGIRHRVTDSEAKILVTNAENVERVRALDLPVEHVLVLDEDLIASGDPAFRRVDTAADDPAQLYYTSGTTGLAKGILHAHRYLLGHTEFELCHDVQAGERFHGMGEWAWAAGIAPLLGPWRFGAVQVVYEREAGFDPAKQLAFLSKYEVTNVFSTPTAIRSMMAIDDAATRYPQRFRVVCAAGEPLNPEAIRWFREQYGVTVLDFYGLSESYPLCGNFPFMDVREGSMGRPMPGWDVAILDEDERPVPAGERGEICLRARSNPHYPLGYWNNEEAARETFDGAVVPHEGRRAHGRGRLRLVRGARGRRDHLGRLPDRPVRGRVGLPRAPGRGRGGRRCVAGRAPREHRQGVRGPRGGLRADGRDSTRDPGARADAALRLPLPATGRVRLLAAEDADREDPADRAARGGGEARTGSRGGRLLGANEAPGRPRCRRASCRECACDVGAPVRRRRGMQAMTVERPLEIRPPRSFAEAAEAHLDDVFGYLLYLTRDRETAEDLSGSTFEKALTRWDRFDPQRGSARTWLLGIARTTALDWFRAESRRRRREEAAARPEQVDEAFVEGLSPELETALAALSAGEREVLALRIVLELDGDAAARVLGISPTAVSTRLSRALKRLEEKVNER